MSANSQGFQTKNVDQVATALQITVADLRKVATHLGLNAPFTSSQEDQIRQFVTSAKGSNQTIQQAIAQSAPATATATTAAGTSAAPVGQNVSVQGLVGGVVDMGQAQQMGILAAQMATLQNMKNEVVGQERLAQIAFGTLQPANPLEQQMAFAYRNLILQQQAIRDPFGGSGLLLQMEQQMASGQIDLNAILNSSPTTITPALPSMIGSGSPESNIKLLGAAQ